MPPRNQIIRPEYVTVDGLGRVRLSDPRLRDHIERFAGNVSPKSTNSSQCQNGSCDGTNNGYGCENYQTCENSNNDFDCKMPTRHLK